MKYSHFVKFVKKNTDMRGKYKSVNSAMNSLKENLETEINKYSCSIERVFGYALPENLTADFCYKNTNPKIMAFYDSENNQISLKPEFFIKEYIENPSNIVLTNILLHECGESIIFNNFKDAILTPLMEDVIIGWMPLVNFHGSSSFSINIDYLIESNLFFHFKEAVINWGVEEITKKRDGLSICFSDENFSVLKNNYPSPKKLLNYLNKYYNLLSQNHLCTGRLISKFINEYSNIIGFSVKNPPSAEQVIIK